jgi:hypothetical protein
MKAFVTGQNQNAVRTTARDVSFTVRREESMGRVGRGILTGMVGMPAVLFIVMGLRWLLDPAGIAPSLGLSLETGLGLSTQVGDLAAFFLVLGLCTLVALVTGQRAWYYPGVLLLLIAAVGRLIAWVLHGAALPLQMIGFEIVIALVLLAASRWLPDQDII